MALNSWNNSRHRSHKRFLHATSVNLSLLTKILCQRCVLYGINTQESYPPCNIDAENNSNTPVMVAVRRGCFLETSLSLIPFELALKVQSKPYVRYGSFSLRQVVKSGKDWVICLKLLIRAGTWLNVISNRSVQGHTNSHDTLLPGITSVVW